MSAPSGRRLRIGVDAACLANERGYGRFARELIRAMVNAGRPHEFILFADQRAALPAGMDGARVVTVPQHVSPTVAAASTGSRSVSDMLRFTRAVWREPLDVFFSPSVYTFFPLPPGLPAVTTIHDAIAERFPALTLPSWRARTFWRLKTRLALWQSRLILTVSDFAAAEIEAVHRLAPDRIRIAVEAPSPTFAPSSAAEIAAAADRIGLPRGHEWFVYLGGFNPHKHVDVVIRAHAAIVRESGTPPHLVLVGAIDGDVFHGARAGLLAEIERSETAALVHWTGFLPDEEVRAILGGAVALLLPSANEGFGLPAVEAAACGTPVIATTASPLPGLLEGGGIFVAPGDQDAVEAGMRTLLRDRPTREAMGARALERASRLHWADAANAALDALEDAAA